jgi:uncharacterized SAM-binding protein YcdF (DUF218 family)
LIGLLIFGPLAFVFREPLLRSLADYLIVDESPSADAPADMILVLTGGADTRPFRAAELFHQGLAPQVAIVQMQDTPEVRLGLVPNETAINVGVLEAEGVPQSSIVVIPCEGGATSTRDEAVALRAYTEAHHLARVIIVTSALHTRRARWVFRHEMGETGVELMVVPAPHTDFDTDEWWRSEYGLVYLLNEYIKFAYYRLSYG